MSDPVRFLNAFAHSLGVMTLYPEGHPSREKAVDSAFDELDGLTLPGGRPPAFTFLEDEVVFGRERLRELKSWDWGKRLVAAGIRASRVRAQGDARGIRRLPRGSARAPDALDDRHQRGAADAIAGHPLRRRGSAGAGRHRSGARRRVRLAADEATLDLTLGEEAETFRWLQTEVQSNGSVPLLEAEAVVRSLSVAMHGDSRMVLPLLKLKEFDQYTTTHSLNVAVLSMGLAESLGCRPKEIRAIGVAGLLHDIGKIRIPLEVLTKPGKLNDEERAIMNSHPIDGARIIMQSEEDLGMAATVAYEHHIMLNGGGYPALHYKRECAMASRLVHVCDVYDALSTKRPVPRRVAGGADDGCIWKSAPAREFDPDLVAAFIRTLRQGQAQVRVLSDEPQQT